MSWTNPDLSEVRAIGGESGVFARCDIPPGTVIGVFDGTADVFAVDAAGKVDWRGQDGSMSVHLALRDNKLYAIMPTKGSDPAGIDFINHSCKANCKADGGVLVVESLQPIAQGEELTINYHRMDLVKLGRLCWCLNVPDSERCVL